MTRLDAFGAVEGELLLPDGFTRDRLQQERVVVAGIEVVEHAPDEPVPAAFEDRDAAGTGMPRRVIELIGGVLGLTTEQLGQVARVGRNGMDTERFRVLPSAKGAVPVRQADDEPRRVDAALRGESDGTAERTGRGDDEHRVLEVTDHAFERVHDVSTTRSS